ncbi:hypothetical protein NEOLEDRAFT_1121684 [Neolentinus lepideus HHB14362 ss-1]|uniref:PalH-domain-containing protein n=1 Tax=Neolentinus lepideus HHB14362 ss-1 TaxID=1314782 RepID=A0A165PIM0_9AGAM|nr:hypothetical protein NEOLEDRAFT_1121684 [Neolentinus lepideus HHB14362 ss-1]
MQLRQYLLTLCFCVGYVLADDNLVSDDGSFPSDPILKFRPAFARSLPVQILLTGVVLTLVGVLLIQLIFTAQYHWPLAPVNFVLQISGVTTLLISLIATLHQILCATMEESKGWPYMLSYLAVDVPPLQYPSQSEWETAEVAAWLMMNATTSALIQITHIQFLTLLYPSKVEKTLIFLLLGPLAIVHAGTQLAPIHASQKVIDMADNISNVCNATLTLLFTASLLSWGFLVNRKKAWRTDGGTAAFGAGAIALAIASTTLTFTYIPSKDQYEWFPGLMWAVVLWQSFLGWWWWVGAGMGVGEVEELLKREEKRARKRRMKLEKRREQKEKAGRIWREVTGAFHKKMDEEDIREQAQFVQSSWNNSATWGALRQLSDTRAGRVVQSVYFSLRRSHLTAARQQAAVRSERKHQVYGGEGLPVEGSNGAPGVVGWGLGSFGIREREFRENDKYDCSETEDIELDDVSQDKEVQAAKAESTGVQATAGSAHPQDPRSSQRSSVWWWGPLRQWRLRDSTVY